MSVRTYLLSAGLALAAALSLAPPARAAENQGFLHGTVETIQGNRYTGILRWGREEAFWDDLFNATKADEPATGRLPKGYKRPSRKVEVFGLEISGPWESAWSRRQFVARFGDIEEIRPRRGDRLEIVMKGGETHSLGGGSNDVGATVTVWDASLGQVKVEWNRIKSVRFSATPAGVQPPAERLRATVRTSAGEFHGFLQWDSEESWTTDKLDGDTDDGKMSIEMGKIRAIEKRSRRSSRVELVDGRVLVMSGSNDVDSSIRGVVVEDDRFGRVEIPWSAFERAEISVAPDSGKGYDAYGPARPLSARVTTVDGKSYSGRIAYDLDEVASWEMLNGTLDDVEYSIPFERIRGIRNTRRSRAEVELVGGRKLMLEGSTDVGDGNAGIAFLGPERREGTPDYLPWEDVAEIRFE